jgi:hypothetical protein
VPAGKVKGADYRIGGWHQPGGGVENDKGDPRAALPVAQLLTER